MSSLHSYHLGNLYTDPNDIAFGKTLFGTSSLKQLSENVMHSLDNLLSGTVVIFRGLMRLRNNQKSFRATFIE